MSSRKRVVADDSDDDVPLSTSTATAAPPLPSSTAAAVSVAANGTKKKDAESDSEDEVPLAKRVAVKGTDGKPVAAVKTEKKDESKIEETKKPTTDGKKNASGSNGSDVKPKKEDTKPKKVDDVKPKKEDDVKLKKSASGSNGSDVKPKKVDDVKPKKEDAKKPDAKPVETKKEDDNKDKVKKEPSSQSTAAAKRKGSKKSDSDKSDRGSDSDSDSDVPLSKRKKVLDAKGKAPATATATATKVKQEASSSPVKSKPGKRKADASSSSSSAESESGSDDDSSGSSASEASDSEDDKPLAKRKPAASSSSPLKKPKDDEKKPAVKRAKSEKKEPADTSSDLPAKKKRGSKKKGEDEEEDEDDVFKWWEQTQNDGEQKWKTLEHNGVFFPPDYVPHNVQLIYDGKKLKLPPAGEEVASFFAAVVDTDWGKNKVFQQNFFRDFKEVLKETEKNGHSSVGIKEFAKCDFSLIAAYLAEQREQRKTRTKEDKQREKEEKKRLDDKYGWCMLDSRKEKVGNFRIEPPGLFRGRGAHPKAGTLKTRVRPEQVTINIGEDAKVPSPPPGHSWASVVHNNKATWLATWNENVNGATKYVFLAATSTLKGMSDMKKYDKARELKKHIKKIREQYQKELTDNQTVTRQRATALYLIDKLALRAGNEKDTDEEADTVGCCSLRVEHIVLKDDNMVVFDFLGKDSMRYHNEVKVDPIVHKNLLIFKRGKKDDTKKTGDLLFDRINTGLLNKHLNGLMPGLSAKVFRTYNASITFQGELEKNSNGVKSVPELVLAYNRANREAAILCNHQRSIPKALQSTLNRLDDKVKLLKLERRRYRLDVLEQQPGRRKGKGKGKAGTTAGKKKAPPKKKKSKSNDDDDDQSNDDDDDDDEPSRGGADDDDALKSESDFDEEMIEETEKLEERLEEEKDEKKKKAAEEKGESYTPSSPKKRSSKLSVDQLLKKIHDIDEKIQKVKVEKIDKDENKTTALGTSKINYLDPRITVAWCKKHGKANGIDPKDLFSKVFNKSLQDKFRWAWESAGADFVF